MNYSEFEGRLFGGTVKIVIYDISPELAQPYFEEVYQHGMQLQKIFNFYDPSSEISALNKIRELKVSNELLNVLKKAIEYCKITSGAYDVTLGKNIIDRKNGKELQKLSCSYKDVKISGNMVYLQNADALIDLGSIAKGYIADKMAEFLKEKGVESFFIDARGDMLVHGRYEETVQIQHPRDKSKTLRKITLKNEAIATSGDYNQFYGNYDKSHILNKKDLISTTVIASNLTDADVFTSAVFLLEGKKREELIKKSNKFKVFTIDEKLNEKSYNGIFPIISRDKSK